MYINEYQKKAHSFAEYKDEMYPVLGLAEEAGEVCGKIAKHLRANGRVNCYKSDTDLASKVRKELGDVAWFVAELCTVYGWDLEDILVDNIRKLEDRMSRGVIIGEGDNR